MTDTTSSGTALALVPPQPVTAITDAQAEKQAQQIDPAAKQQIDATVAQYISTLLSADPHSPQFDTQLNAVHNLGDADIRASAAVSNRLLDRPAKAMESGPFDPKSNVSNSLVKLRRTVEDLDPTQQGLFGKKHLWGTLPFGNTLRDYFHKYEASQKTLDALTTEIEKAQGYLQRAHAGPPAGEQLVSALTVPAAKS